MQEFLDRRKMTEFGSLALVDDGDGDGVHISLPGVRRGWEGLGCLGYLLLPDYDPSDASAQVT